MAIPSVPVNVIIQQANGQVLVSWDPSTGVPADYPVFRSTDGITFAQVGDPTTTQFLDTTVVIGTNYFYQILAHNVSGNSAPSLTVNIVPSAAGILSLQQVRLLAKQRADRVNSRFVTDDEWNSYINQSYFELYDILVTSFEDYFVQAPWSFKTDGSTFQYPLPDGVTIKDFFTNLVVPSFYKLVGVDLGLDNANNAFVTLKKFEFLGRNRYVFPQVTSTFLGVFNLRYRLVGSTLMFIPTPSANQVVRVWYVPRLKSLLLDSDMMDGISGWTEYVITDAAIKAIQKEEGDTQYLTLQKEGLLKRIEQSAMNRDIGQPDTITDSRTRTERWGAYGPPNSDGGWAGW